MSLESAIAHNKNSSSNSVNSRTLLPRLECRKIRKPKIEKLRRARINSSLESLKEILLKNTISIPQGARPTKLEKADVLEMTVRYIELLHEECLPAASINRRHQQQQQQQRRTTTTTTPQSMTFKQQRLLNDITNKMNCHRPSSHHQQHRHHQPHHDTDELPLLMFSATSHPQAERENSLDKENFTRAGEGVDVKQESSMNKYHWRPWWAESISSEWAREVYYAEIVWDVGRVRRYNIREVAQILLSFYSIVLLWRKGGKCVQFKFMSFRCLFYQLFINFNDKSFRSVLSEVVLFSQHDKSFQTKFLPINFMLLRFWHAVKLNVSFWKLQQLVEFIQQKMIPI